MDAFEANLYLPIESKDDLDDAYDEALFELKQFFLNRIPSSKLIRLKESKMNKLQLAFEFYGGVVGSRMELSKLKSFETKVVQEAFNLYQSQNNKLKVNLASATNILDLILVLEQQVTLLAMYASMFPDVHGEGVKIMKEPDLIEMAEELEKQKELKFDAISELDTENCIYKEAIRLSLWLKLEKDG